MIFTKFKHAKIAIEDKAVSRLAQIGMDLEIYADLAPTSQERADLILSWSSKGLNLQWNRQTGLPFHYHLDFEAPVRQLRSFPAPKQGAFNQALGKKTKTVLDATGGWGGDALLMCMQGYAVTVVERIPIMAAMLKDAFLRLGQSNWAIQNQLDVPDVICADAKQIINDFNRPIDCVYLDPMFPPKRKKAAASNKYMQLLQWLAGADLDADMIAAVARTNFPRMVVKRPNYASSLCGPPQARFSSKLVHFDVYL